MCQKVEIGQVYDVLKGLRGGSYMVLDIVVRESGTRQGKWVTKILVADERDERHAISLGDFGRDILQKVLILQSRIMKVTVAYRTALNGEPVIEEEITVTGKNLKQQVAARARERQMQLAYDNGRDISYTIS